MNRFCSHLWSWEWRYCHPKIFKGRRRKFQPQIPLQWEVQGQAGGCEGGQGGLEHPGMVKSVPRGVGTRRSLMSLPPQSIPCPVLPSQPQPCHSQPGTSSSFPAPLGPLTSSRALGGLGDPRQSQGTPDRAGGPGPAQPTP